MTELDDVVQLELRLLEPEVRRDRTALQGLLDPDFREVGASGQQWDLDGILAELTTEAGAPPPARHVEARHVSDDVVLVTYLCADALRSSVWRRRPEGWRLLYHQGTQSPLP